MTRPWVWLLLVACAGRHQGSLVLQERVADEAGPAGERFCPWSEVPEVRLEREVVWVDDTPWSVEGDSGGQAFTEALALCGRTPAIAAFREWRLEEARVERTRKAQVNDPGGQLGAALVAGAAESVAGSEGQVAHAMRDQNLRPAAPLATPHADQALERARQALIDEIRGTE